MNYYLLFCSVFRYFNKRLSYSARYCVFLNILYVRLATRNKRALMPKCSVFLLAH